MTARGNWSSECFATVDSEAEFVCGVVAANLDELTYDVNSSSSSSSSNIDVLTANDMHVSGSK